MSAEVVHRLGVLLWGATGTLLLATGWRARRRRRAALSKGGRLLGGVLRARHLVASAGSAAGGFDGPPPGARRFRLADGRLRGPLVVAGAAAAGYVVLGGVWGALAGGVGGWLLHRRGGAGSSADHRHASGAGGTGDAPVDTAACEAQLPLAADLLAACVAAGAGPVDAAEAVGESLGGPVGTRLAQVAAEVRLGGDPARAWAGFGALPGAAGLARLLERATASGAPAAEPVTRLAATCRARWAQAATARAQRAGVLVTAPLGLCFLPAFLAVGVVPVLIGLAGGLLTR